MQDRTRLIERPLTPDEYAGLRAAVGWWPVEGEGVARGLANDLLTVCMLRGDELIGCGRVTGDGGIYFEIHDVIVLPAFRGRGLGRRIMEALMAWITQRAARGAAVSLLAADGMHAFYEPFGFEVRPAGAPGMMLRL